MRSPLYGTYERMLARALRDSGEIPRHIGVILDGNRRWAKMAGASAAHGHQRGADKITEVLTWSHEMDVEVVTLWMLSTDNLSRENAEITDLLDIIACAVERLAEDGRWRLQMVGDLTLLPKASADRLHAAAATTAHTPADDGRAPLHVNIAVGYGGRHEIADAVKSMLRAGVQAGKSLEQVAESFSVDEIADHLYTKGQPDPDLVIRTSGEQRLSGFLLWQSAHSEFYFCDAYWPDFRRVDFLRALRSYSLRERRLGR